MGASGSSGCCWPSGGGDSFDDSDRAIYPKWCWRCLCNQICHTTLERPRSQLWKRLISVHRRVLFLHTWEVYVMRASLNTLRLSGMPNGREPTPGTRNGPLEPIRARSDNMFNDYWLVQSGIWRIRLFSWFPFLSMWIGGIVLLVVPLAVYPSQPQFAAYPYLTWMVTVYVGCYLQGSRTRRRLSGMSDEEVKASGHVSMTFDWRAIDSLAFRGRRIVFRSRSEKHQATLMEVDLPRAIDLVKSKLESKLSVR